MPAGSTYTPIATTTLGSAQADITFSSIAGTYTDLVLVLYGRASRADTSSGTLVNLNSDTGTNYSQTRIEGDGTSAVSARNSNQTSMINADIAANNLASGIFSQVIWQFMNYSNTTTYKTVLVRTASASNEVKALVSLWRSTSAITTIKVAPSGGFNFMTGTQATLYGIAAA